MSSPLCHASSLSTLTPPANDAGAAVLLPLADHPHLAVAGDLGLDPGAMLAVSGATDLRPVTVDVLSALSPADEHGQRVRQALRVKLSRTAARALAAALLVAAGVADVDLEDPEADALLEQADAEIAALTGGEVLQ
jgi:hypothetical protein